ncbi:MAG TPA: M20 family metallopeptidase [Bryobacteraceae bacterium]|jgi:glutamate carboxypeptidase|nr:M20 family metallopeptidase [Bryobacteraceae bacterium]
MHPFLRYVTEKQAETIANLKAMVECESPTDSPADVNRFVDLLVERTRDIAKAKTFKADACGKHLRLDFALAPRKKSGQILALGHSDTVWPLGTLKTMPFRQSGGRLWGPGVLDMKSGLAFFVMAIRTLRDLDVPVARKIVLLVVSDEETGSRTSRALTEAEAKQSDCVLVLEPGTGLTGKLKTARKGIANYAVEITGKAAHAGVDFENGASAILETARQIERISAWTDLQRGITVNPGVVNGGTRTNVVAAQARVEFDVRAVRLRDSLSLDRKFRALKPYDKRCTLRVEGGLNRPPMERTKAIARLFAKAQKIGNGLDLQLEESATGGGSDGNFTAALGVPTLDGLGGVGEGAHASNENILVNRIADRTALLAGLLASL